MPALRRFEYVVPADRQDAKARLDGKAAFVRRSQIEDAFFLNPAGAAVRLRRQDGLCRLACTRPIAEDVPETVILDHGACLEFLRRLGFREAGRVRVIRDVFRYRHFGLFVDRVEGLGDFLVVEAEAGKKAARRLEAEAKALLRELGLFEEAPLPRPSWSAIDMAGALPYTGPVEIAT